MIDEIQDLPHAVSLLLTKVTEQGIFFSGDTAQTIAKGVGFKLSDLSKIFNPVYFDGKKVTKPVLKQLTVNYLTIKDKI